MCYPCLKVSLSGIRLVKCLWKPRRKTKMILITRPEAGQRVTLAATTRADLTLRLPDELRECRPTVTQALSWAWRFSRSARTILRMLWRIRRSPNWCLFFPRLSILKRKMWRQPWNFSTSTSPFGRKIAKQTLPNSWKLNLSCLNLRPRY